MDEMIEFVDESLFFWCIYSSLFLEYAQAVAPDTIEQEIPEDISCPSEYEYGIYIESSE